MPSDDHDDDRGIAVALHVPLARATDTLPGEYEYPWIDRLMEWFFERERDDDPWTLDDSESWHVGDDLEDPSAWEEIYELVQVSDVDAALARLREAARLSWVPDGAYITISTNPTDDFGEGERVEIDPDFTT